MLVADLDGGLGVLSCSVRGASGDVKVMVEDLGMTRRVLLLLERPDAYSGGFLVSLLVSWTFYALSRGSAGPGSGPLKSIRLTSPGSM